MSASSLHRYVKCSLRLERKSNFGYLYVTAWRSEGRRLAGLDSHWKRHLGFVKCDQFGGRPGSSCVGEFVFRDQKLGREWHCKRKWCAEQCLAVVTIGGLRYSQRRRAGSRNCEAGSEGMDTYEVLACSPRRLRYVRRASLPDQLMCARGK